MVLIIISRSPLQGDYSFDSLYTESSSLEGVYRVFYSTIVYPRSIHLVLYRPLYRFKCSIRPDSPDPEAIIRLSKTRQRKKAKMRVERGSECDSTPDAVGFRDRHDRASKYIQVQNIPSSIALHCRKAHDRLAYAVSDVLRSRGTGTWWYLTPV
ncbi:uncharacterized protein ASPGLDRAFT_848921 [Aspergillus glaucus CBS 516.65]|uniref:Uncharacterized protein n=1 Tax=Aspergillus glaucus CBS 516.65 TaxID=1160497 RepID=A0A1L9V9E2_ASPGL|nr:hypothetical protein ASPGLDRAFT_848921 [Aspergillus glaucus CBS 516.65]OJJ80530.1 hypothetical protein ASPGLDRAFT_848921 [Aspergillus glaucus CBS 516.65]